MTGNSLTVARLSGYHAQSARLSVYQQPRQTATDQYRLIRNDTAALRNTVDQSAPMRGSSM